MKKMMRLVSSLVLLIALVACGPQVTSNGKLQIATSSYALKYFIERIGGDDVDVIFSFTSNPHHLELTPVDAQAIARADAFLNVEVGDYINIGNQLRNINQGLKSFDVSADIALLESGDTHEHEHVEHYDKIEEKDDTASVAKANMDPHVWLDPIRAGTLVTNIEQSLRALRPERADFFSQNAQRVQEELTALDTLFKTELTTIQQPYILVNHAAYGYLSDRYHFMQKAISDVSDHSENTQTSIIELDEFISQHNIRYIFIEPHTELNTMVQVLSNKYQLNKVTLFNLETPVNESADYFALMEQNAHNIKNAVI